MSESNDSTEATEPQDAGSTEPTPERAEEILEDPARLLDLIPKRPEMLDDLAFGLRAVRDGFGGFLTANDRGAARVKDTADRVLDLIKTASEQEGVDAEERNQLLDRAERTLGKVEDTEEKVRAANERSFGKLVVLGGTAAAGILVLGYMAKTGKLPPISPPTA